MAQAGSKSPDCPSKKEKKKRKTPSPGLFLQQETPGQKTPMGHPQPALGGKKQCLSRVWQFLEQRPSHLAANTLISCPCCLLRTLPGKIGKHQAEDTSTPVTLLLKRPLPSADRNRCPGFPSLLLTKGLKINCHCQDLS